ncbi:MAG: DGQHR domain-containing protein, partial [Candidatus Hodarchaeota archaeon]
EEEAALVLECKSTEKRKFVNYQKDINEFIAIKEKIRIAVRKLFTDKTKVAFIFATNNAVLNDNDRKRLSSDNIFHFTQDDIEYFEQLTDHLGAAAKYQLFGILFKGQKIPQLKNRVPAIKGKVAGGHTFYSFSVEPEFLLKIGFILHRSETSAETSTAYQRLVRKKRLNKIGKYIDKGGYFPNSIIINIQTTSTKELRFDLAGNLEHDSETSLGILYLPKTYRSAFIIDGQHRLYGYSKAKSESHHTIPVVAFHNMPPEEQARIFVDINHTQKSVPANLLNSIMADFHWGSDNVQLAISALKTRLFTILNSDDTSPFYKRIILSEEKETKKRCLTLKSIRDWGLSKVDFFGTLKGDKLIKTGYLSDVDYEKTLSKSSTFLKKCFSKIQSGLEDQWEKGKDEGGFIAMNIGVTAMLRAIDNILEYLTKFKSLKPENLSGEELADAVNPYLEPVIEFLANLDYEGLRKLRSYFGTGAPGKVLREFQYAIYREYEDFKPDGLDQWIKEHSGVFNKPAYELGHDHIEPIIDEFVKFKLKEEFGEKYWWLQGVPKTIQKDCSDRRIDEGTDEPDWHFLNTIHYHTIIEKNWGILGEYFTPPGMENAKKSKKLDWLKKFNSIRQKYSHPQRENTTEEEYVFLEGLYGWLRKKLIKNS